MSTGGNTRIKCVCGHRFETWIWQSANVTASPELKQKVLEGAMNVAECPSCRKRFLVEMPFLYHDLEAREWIWVYPHDQEQEAREIHAKVSKMWEEVKSRVPSEVRDAFENEYKVIVLFGMDALVFYLKGKAAMDSERAST